MGKKSRSLRKKQNGAGAIAPHSEKPAEGAAPRLPGGRPGGEGPQEKLWVTLIIGIAIFLLILYFAAFEEQVFLVLPVLALASMAAGHFLRKGEKKRVTGTEIFLLLFLALCGAASVYADLNELAGVAFSKWLALACLVLIAGALFQKKWIHTVLLGLATGIALNALFSVDAVSSRGMTELILGKLLRIDITPFYYWGDGRISGLFANPNISASIFALGILLSLYGVRATEKRELRILACVNLAFSSMAFFLSFSMGGIGFFLVAVIVYLATASKEERLPLFLLMAETGVSTVLFSVLATLGLGKTGAVTVIPNLAMALNGITIWLLDRYVGRTLAAKLATNGRAVALTLAGVGGAAAVYLVLAFQLTGPINLNPGEQVSRSTYPAAGAYRLEAQGAADLQIKIRAQDSSEIPMHASTTVYEGPAQGAQYTVPEGTRVVHFELLSQQGGALETVTYSGASDGALKLRYLLLPEFAAKRIQGLWANQNVVQRVSFFEDALKIWRKSPVLGMGMGAYEGYRPEVADFHYVTRYVHNVYLQAMAETGLVGLVLLLGVAGAFFVAVARGRRADKYGTVAPPLLACLAMMWGHGSFEVIWSNTPFLLVAGLTLGAAQVLFGAYLPIPRLESRGARRAVAVLSAGVLVASVGLLSLDGIYEMKLQRAGALSYEEYMRTVAASARFNVYRRDFFRTVYLDNVFLEEEEGRLATADGYAARLATRGSCFYGVNAAQYYFKRGDITLAFGALEGAALRGKADPEVWDLVVNTAKEQLGEGESTQMTEGLRALAQLWQQVSAQQMDGAPFSAEEMAFLKGYL